MMETLHFGIQEIFKEKLFCDVQLCFKHGSVLNLHKLILASSSSFILECLINQTNEETACIILPDFDLHEFRYIDLIIILLRFSIELIYIILNTDFSEILPYLYGTTNQNDFNVSNDLIQTLKLGNFNVVS